MSMDRILEESAYTHIYTPTGSAKFWGNAPLPCRVLDGPNLWGQYKVAILLSDGTEHVRWVKHVRRVYESGEEFLASLEDE